MKQHPLSAAFPAMAADEFQALVDSVTNNGVINPITTYEGMVLDGWHRFTAANEAGVACPMVELGDVDPQAFVIAQNKDRRHIAQGQIAFAVAAVYQWKPAHREKAAPGAGLSKTTEEMATLAGVSERTMRQAKAVEAKATPKVKEAVKTGEISVKRGAEIAQLPVKEQVKALRAPKPEAEDIHYVGPSDEEIAVAQESAAADMVAFEALMAADDKLAAAVEEIKKLKMQLVAVESQRDGYMNRSNELIARITTLKRKLAKAEAAHV
jgi:ParB-like chromosome segregation protein Spo0J